MMSRLQSCEEGESAASQHENPTRTSKLPSEKVVLLVLGSLLAVSLVIICRLSFVMLETNEHLNSLKDKNEALRRNISGEIHLKKTPDWENYQERLYFFSTNKSSWNESRRSCKDLGGDLVKIDSREEQVFLEIRVRGLMEEAEDKFWIGLTDAEEEGRWFWVDGSPLNESLSFWSDGEPNNYAERTPAGEDCVPKCKFFKK
ncbi:C-type lectin domain family 4 member E-like [Fundulus heteroclitus]|uniref:C-type lectin domain family 4 member E-like n=1 Tax=Fundulus heteroclitus TaxID=8078 RepID=UPI00165B213B|nr:C-type lectin domain family 4 member E-like [Fundulus heteroclitus]